jgi:hypothetical protein
MQLILDLPDELSTALAASVPDLARAAFESHRAGSLSREQALDRSTASIAWV